MVSFTDDVVRAIVPTSPDVEPPNDVDFILFMLLMPVDTTLAAFAAARPIFAYTFVGSGDVKAEVKAETTPLSILTVASPILNCFARSKPSRLASDCISATSPMMLADACAYWFSIPTFDCSSFFAFSSACFFASSSSAFLRLISSSFIAIVMSLAVCSLISPCICKSFILS